MVVCLSAFSPSFTISKLFCTDKLHIFLTKSFWVREENRKIELQLQIHCWMDVMMHLNFVLLKIYQLEKGKGNEEHTRKPIFCISDKIKRWNVFRWLLFFFLLLFVCFPCYCLCRSHFVEYVRFIPEHYWKSNDPTTIEIIDVRAANHKSFQIREIVLTMDVSEWMSVFVFLCQHFFIHFLCV